MKIKKPGTFFLYITIGIITLVLISGILFDVALWVDSGYDPDFRAIDSCFDGGGVWDKETGMCEKE